MADAISLFYYILTKFTDWIFNDATILVYSNVDTGFFGKATIGWILFTIFILAILIRSILNLPIGLLTRKENYDHGHQRNYHNN